MSDLFKELDEAVGREVESNEKIKTLLTGLKAQYKVVKVGDLELKIRPTIPKTIRHEMDKLQDSEELKKLENVEELTYRMLAEMSIEPEFQKPEIWHHIDNETGMAFDLLGRVYQEANDTHSQIKRFR